MNAKYVRQCLNGSLTDVVEMDAASNNSVEDVRAIREEVNFLPTLAKYRVYIIDEVHMLSTGAFNALLKTLEEPPKHVKFILATTEPQKLPPTILSRCQRFDFKTISEEDIIKRLKIVCKEADIEISEEALNIIAVLSEGAMRDSLSILERCIQDGVSSIDESKVKELIGIPKTISIQKIVKAIIDSNIEMLMKEVNDILQEGKDILNLLWEVIKYVNDILLYKVTKEAKLYNKNEIEQIKSLSEKISKEKLLNVIYELSILENNLKWSSQKRIMFEVGMIKLCINPDIDGLKELNDRITKLEEKIKQPPFNVGKSIARPEEKKQEGNKEEVSIGANIANPKASQKNVVSSIARPKEINTNTVHSNNMQEEWSKIVNNLKNSGKIILYTNLINTEANKVNDMIVEIIFPNGITAFGKTVLEKPENKQEIERLISMECGTTMKVKYVDNKNEVKNSINSTLSIEELANNLDIPIQISED